MEATTHIPLYLSGLVPGTILCVLFLHVTLPSALWMPGNPQENMLIINLTNEPIRNNLLALTYFLFLTSLYST